MGSSLDRLRVVIFLLPVFPDDTAGFLAGLTRLLVWKIVVAAVPRRLPGMAVLAFVGARAGKGSTVAYVVLGRVTAIGIALWLYSDELEERVKRRVAR